MTPVLFNIVPFLFQILAIGLFLLLVAAALAPFESLGWWAGWPSRFIERQVIAEEDEQDRQVEQTNEAKFYLVYLSGIGAISGDFLEPHEIEFCDELARRFPDATIVNDVFPYAMNNRGLTSHRLFTWMWLRIKQLKIEGKYLLANLINIRNLFQVTVSADRRYGPIYNYGTAEVIRDGLLRKGYRIGSGKTVAIIGFSGGCQIALGAATTLRPMLQGAPLYVLSLGGVMADDPGLNVIEHLYHFYGTKDPIQNLGALAYAGRWPILPYSPWNKAKSQGKISRINLGPMTHIGVRGYFSPTGHMENGQRCLDHSLEAITQVLREQIEKTIPPPETSIPNFLLPPKA